MKKTILLVAMVAALTTQTLFAQVPSYVPANGLVGYWPFSGNANDLSGNNNNGTVNGATLTADRFGNSNSAYSFDGISNFISVLENESLKPTNSISLSAWVYIDPTINGNFVGIINKELLVSPSYSSYQLITGNAGFNQTGDPGISLRTTNSYQWTDVTGSSFLNQWAFIVGTYDGTQLKCYHNGVLVATKQQNGTIQYTSSNINFGRTTNANGVGENFYFKGNIDDIGIWNRALTQQEINNLYNSSLPQTACLPANVPTSGLVGYWPFCGNANDESGNGNNGNVNGAILTADRYGNTNKAYNFNGSTNYIEVPNSNSLSNISEITISAWVYIDSWFQSGGDGYFPILHKSNLQGQYGKYALSLTSLGGISHLNSQENGFGYNNWTLGVWKHVVMIFSNNRNKIYVDGDLISDFPTGVFPNSINNSLPLIIGMDKPGLVEYSNGKIDDLGIWNRELTSQEIANLYNNNLNSDEFIVEKNIVSVYPNPASTQININFNNITNLNGGTLKIINSLGQQVATTPITTSGTNSTMQLATWGGTGMYFVQIINPQGQIVDIKKIILQ